MPYKQWSQEEIDKLVELFSRVSVSSLANLLDRTEQSVKSKASKLGLKRCVSNKWLPEEDEFLRLNYLGMTNLELSNNLLDRTERAVGHRLTLLGLSRQGYNLDYSTSNYLNFYVIRCKDVDNTIFYKFGWTSKSDIKARFPGKDYEVLLVYRNRTSNIRKFEDYIKNIMINYKYKPLDKSFYSTGHSGFTECFVVKNEPINLMLLCLDNLVENNYG